MLIISNSSQMIIELKNNSKLFNYLMDVYQITFVGETGSGKTTIIEAYQEHSSNHHLYSRETKSLETVIPLKNGEELNVFILDTAGHERFRSFAKFFLKKAKAVVIVYDTQRREHYQEAVNYWYNTVIETVKDPVIALVGFNYRQSPVEDEEEARQFAKEHNCIFKIVSYEEYINIDELFQEIGKQLYYNKFYKDKFIISDKKNNNKQSNKEKCYK